MKLPKLFVIAIWSLGLILSLSSQASDSALKTPTQVDQDKKASLMLTAGYSTADNTQADGVTFYEFGAGVGYTLSPRLTLNGQIAQGLLTSTFGSGFTSFGIGFEYFLMGNNQLSQRHVSMGSYNLFKMQSVPEQALSMAFHARQVYFNGSSQVYPFSGFGVCAKCRPFAFSVGSWGLDLCYDTLLNPPNTTSMFRGLIGASIFLF